MKVCSSKKSAICNLFRQNLSIYCPPSTYILFAFNRISLKYVKTCLTNSGSGVGAGRSADALKCVRTGLPVFGHFTDYSKHWTCGGHRTISRISLLHNVFVSSSYLAVHFTRPRRCEYTHEMSASPPEPPLQNPLAGTTIDTSPQTLGLTESGNGNMQTSAARMPVTNAATNSSPSRSPSNSKNVLKRTMEQATSKLGSSMLNISRRDGKGPGFQGNKLSASLGTVSPRHTLSLSRKGKDKERISADGGEAIEQG